MKKDEDEKGRRKEKKMMRIRKEDEKNEDEKGWGWEKIWESRREELRMKEAENEWGREKKMITKTIKKKRKYETQRRRCERKEKGWG